MIYSQVELEVCADLVHRLTVLRQNECKHLCIENYAPALLEKILKALARAQRDM
jgi:hypothetical protein